MGSNSMVFQQDIKDGGFGVESPTRLWSGVVWGDDVEVKA